MRQGAEFVLTTADQREFRAGDAEALTGQVKRGEADLTVHADFPAVAEAARSAGIAVAPLLTQGEFLGRLGIGARAAALARAHPERADQIGRQLHRLTDPEEMGTLFKVLCLHEPGLQPPGFEP